MTTTFLPNEFGQLQAIRDAAAADFEYQVGALRKFKDDLARQLAIARFNADTAANLSATRVLH